MKTRYVWRLLCRLFILPFVYVAAVMVTAREIWRALKGRASDKQALGTDCKALLTVRDALRGTAALNWRAGLDIALWEGVELRDGRVVGLYLPNYGLTGNIPPALGRLTSLKGLALGYNQLTGEIPSELGMLSNLESLSLNDNQLTGAIPPSLGNLENLWSLDLRHNQLTGSVPSELGTLSQLGTLHLEYNQLTGTIPSTLGKLTNLTHLSLHNNQLTGVIPFLLIHRSQARFLTLDISGNDDLPIPSELGGP